MDSVGFEVGDEYQPRTIGKKCKLPKTIAENGGAVNHASVPRKLRSATKKRRRKSVAPHLPILKKQCRMSNGIEKHRNNGGKKSKPNMKQKQVHISKDEEEVAKTLFALAGMFSDANKAKQPQLDNEPPENESSAIPEAGCSMNVIEGDERKSELAATEQPNNTESDNVNPRQMVSTLHVIPSDEQAAAMEQVTAHRIGYDMNSLPVDDKDGLFLSTNSSTSIAREMQVSCVRMLEGTRSASRPLLIGNKVPAEKQQSRKRCLAHVYISRLVKDLKVSERKEMSLEKPTATYNQITGLSGTNGSVTFNGTTHLSVENESAKVKNGILTHKRAVQDQQLASETSASCSSAYQGFNFLSLGNGVGGSNHSARLDTPNQFHPPYVQSQGCTTLFFSPSQNGYSAAFQGHNSTLAAQQVQQLPQHPASAVNSSFTTARLGQQPVSQQQKWAAELATQYNANGGRMSGSMLNYTHAVFPHLQSALGYHQPLTLGQQMLLQQQQQQQLMMGLNPTPLPVSDAKRNHLHLPLGLERNGAAFYPETTLQHLQLPCNQHLSN